MKSRSWFQIVALLAATLSASGQTNMITLMSNGPTANRLNIVFFSEGYTTSDLSHFPSDAMTMLNRMLSTPPLNGYANYFNAFAISVPSAQSGADHLTPTTNLVNTYFNSTYDTSGVQRLLTINSTGVSRANALLALFMPEYDLAVIVVNDTQYGGSGGSFLVSSINSQSPEIATHEMGHTFAGLGDEYSDAGSTPSERPNTTAQTNLASIRWNAWIPGGTPIPTPDISTYFNTDGLFQGAAYSTNYYRPKHDCKMRTLGVAFCEICSETFVKTIHTKLNVIESFSPTNNIPVKLTNGAPTAFTVTNLVPAGHALQTQWFTNNVAVPGATSTVFTVSGFDLSRTNANVIRADVTDATAAVRTAPTNMLINSLAWNTTFALQQPPLFIHPIPGLEIVYWTNTANGFTLEQAITLSGPPVWTPLLVISNQAAYTVPPTGPASYFRLRKSFP